MEEDLAMAARGVPLHARRHLHGTICNRRLGRNLMSPTTRGRYTAWSVSRTPGPPCEVASTPQVAE
jgi:hypothetical protein